MKLNEWVDEKVPVQTQVRDEQVNVVDKTIYKTEKVIYIDPPKRKLVCGKGKHNWSCVDKHKYLFSCSNCPRKVIAYPVSYHFRDGQLINKDTNEVV